MENKKVYYELKNSTVVFNEYTYLKDDVEKKGNSLFIKIPCKNDDVLFIKVDIDYKDLKFLKLHLDFNNIDLVQLKND